jgi:hypothetical protein
VNAKAEAYWSLREWLEPRGLAGLTDEETQAQLASIRYRHTAEGRVEIESKGGCQEARAVVARPGRGTGDGIRPRPLCADELASHLAGQTPSSPDPAVWEASDPALAGSSGTWKLARNGIWETGPALSPSV